MTIDAFLKLVSSGLCCAWSLSCMRSYFACSNWMYHQPRDFDSFFMTFFLHMFAHVGKKGHLGGNA